MMPPGGSTGYLNEPLLNPYSTLTQPLLSPYSTLIEDLKETLRTYGI